MTTQVEVHWYDGRDMEPLLEAEFTDLIGKRNLLWSALCHLMDTSTGPAYLIGNPCVPSHSAEREAHVSLMIRQQKWITKQRKKIADDEDYSPPPIPDAAESILVEAIKKQVKKVSKEWLKTRRKALIATIMAEFNLPDEDAKRALRTAVREWRSAVNPRWRPTTDGRRVLRFYRTPVSEDESIQWWLWNIRLRAASDQAKTEENEKMSTLRRAAAKVVSYDREWNLRIAFGSGGKEAATSLDVAADSLAEAALLEVRRRKSTAAVQGFPPEGLWESQFAYIAKGKWKFLKRLYEEEVLCIPRPDNKEGKENRAALPESLDQAMEFGTLDYDPDSEEPEEIVAAEPSSSQETVLWDWAVREAQQTNHTRTFKFQLDWVTRMGSVAQHLDDFDIGEHPLDEAKTRAAREHAVAFTNDNPLTRQMGRFAAALRPMRYILSCLGSPECFADVHSLERDVAILDSCFERKSAILVLLKSASIVACNGMTYRDRDVFRIDRDRFIVLLSDSWEDLAQEVRTTDSIVTYSDVRSSRQEARASIAALLAAGSEEEQGTDGLTALHHAEDAVARTLNRKDPACVAGVDCRAHPFPHPMNDMKIETKEIENYE